MLEIQRACLHFLVADDISRKERVKALEKWAEWLLLFVKASRYRYFINQMLLFYYNQLHDLERLIGRQPSKHPIY